MNFNELPQVSDENEIMFSTEFRSESEYTPEPVGCQRMHNMLYEGRHRAQLNGVWITDPLFDLSGFAEVLFGGPHTRRPHCQDVGGRPRTGGVAATALPVGRKGKAFPHITAAEPRRT